MNEKRLSLSLPTGLRAAQYVLLLAGETAWLYAWAIALGHWLGGDHEPLLSIPGLAALLALAAIAARLAATRKRRPRLARVALGLTGLATAILAGFGPALAATGWVRVAAAWQELTLAGGDVRAVTVGCSVLVVWWRGIRVGRARPTSFAVEEGFWAGILALAGLLVVVALASGASGLGTEPLILPTLAFVAIGLVGMPLARIADLSASATRSSGTSLTPSGPWLATLLGVVTGVLLATLLLAQILTVERIGEALAPLGVVLWTGLYYLLLPFAYLVEGLILVARRYLRIEFPKMEGGSPAFDALEQLRQMNREGGAVASELLTVVKVLLLVALAAAIVGLLARTVFNLRSRTGDDDVEEVRELVWTWPGWSAIWRLLLDWLRPRLRPARAEPTGTDEASEGPAGSIRELYRRFLALGAASGHPRRPTETPHEYEGRLVREAPPGGEEEVDTLTEGYVRVRYGPAPDTPPEISLLVAALARLRERWGTREATHS